MKVIKVLVFCVMLLVVLLPSVCNKNAEAEVKHSWREEVDKERKAEYIIIKGAIKLYNAESRAYRKSMKMDIPRKITELRAHELTIYLMSATGERKMLLWGFILPLMSVGNGFANVTGDNHLDTEHLKTAGYGEFQVRTARWVDSAVLKRNKFKDLTDKEVKEKLILDWEYNVDLTVGLVSILIKKYGYNAERVFKGYTGGNFGQEMIARTFYLKLYRLVKQI